MAPEQKGFNRPRTNKAGREIGYKKQQRRQVTEPPVSSVGKAKSKILADFLKLCFSHSKKGKKQLGHLHCHSHFENEVLSPRRTFSSLCHKKICSACEQSVTGQQKPQCSNIARNLQIK